ncbi:hypothetical protein [Roseivirga misakiensis]|uniref:Uncharacterized protein n=1 Tax=Roseivirga misakiensis TaxID=1563681 RepID=A0A1E5SZY8_9BACT|nr:hypothetical protein [Roseivirga misakiensis]OEK04681.1 hypothetical protein BFP71_14605 [Roseivirga misakiensis]
MSDSKILKYLSDSFDEEAVDLLDNFGYVSFSKDGSDERPNKTAVNLGIKEFRAEYLQSIIYEPNQPITSKHLTEFELDDLAYISDLEGRFKLSEHRTIIKSDALLIRVLRFRLNLLGLVSSVNNQYDTELENGLTQLSKFLQVTSQGELFHLIDDFDELITVAAKRTWNIGFRGLASVSYDGKSSLKRDSDAMKQSLRMVENTGSISSTSVDFYSNDFVDKPWLTKKAEKHLTVIQNHPFNNFIVRLIQIKLWLLGAYGHKIDGDMKLRTIEALEDFHELIESMNTASQQLHVIPSRFVFRMKGGNWLINYKYLLLIGIPNVEVGFDANEFDVKAVSAQLQNLIDQVENQADKDKVLAKVDQLVDEQLNEKVPRRKKKVRKAKGFMRQVVGFFKKAVEWLAAGIQKVIDVISSFFKKVKNAVGYLIREIREAINKTIETFSFFFSKRKITTNNLITSDFDIDFDAVATLSAGYTSTDLEAHQSKVDSLLDTMSNVFGVFGKVIPIVIDLLKGPVGWVKLGIKLVKIILKDGLDSLFKPALSIVKS